MAPHSRGVDLNHSHRLNASAPCSFQQSAERCLYLLANRGILQAGDANSQAGLVLHHLPTRGGHEFQGLMKYIGMDCDRFRRAVASRKVEHILSPAFHRFDHPERAAAGTGVLDGAHHVADLVTNQWLCGAIENSE